MTGAERILLCRPEGGINDILNQIERCCRYAEFFGRRVIVDTDYKNSHYFRSPFSHYFISRQHFLQLNYGAAAETLDTADVYPEFPPGRLVDYQIRWDYALRAHVEVISGTPMSFDFSKDYQHRILLHHNAGGGQLSLFCLMRLRLHDSLTDALMARLAVLPANYAGVHIRHTDLKTNWRGVFTDLRREEIADLFVATDNAMILGEARRSLPATRIHTFSTLPDPPGNPIHVNPPREYAHQRNADALLDLLTLALARNLFIANTVNKPELPYSGFSLLAQRLNRNRTILQGLLDRPELLERVHGSGGVTSQQA